MEAAQKLRRAEHSLASAKTHSNLSAIPQIRQEIRVLKRAANGHR
ncbi:Uncharacterised protein [uncultured archaeon]|nr:Uncharacterised protein [uncultured archaeon]